MLNLGAVTDGTIIIDGQDVSAFKNRKEKSPLDRKSSLFSRPVCLSESSEQDPGHFGGAFSDPS